MNGNAIPHPANSLRSLRILLVDDDAVARRVIETFLKPSGCDIETAIKGRMAILVTLIDELDSYLNDLEARRV